MKHRIVLDLDCQAHGAGDDPSKWNWADLLDLGPDERVNVASCHPLEELGKGQVAVELRLRVVYDANGASPRELQDQLDALARGAATRGQLTGDLPAEVDSWAHQVLVTEHTPAAPAQARRADLAGRAERQRG